MSEEVFSVRLDGFGGPMELGEAFDDAFGGQNGDQLIVHVENGTWSVLRDSGFTAPSQYVTYTAEQNRVALEMERLASFSTCVFTSSSEAIFIVSIKICGSLLILIEP